MRYVEKYETARQATDDNRVRRRKDANTHARARTHTQKGKGVPHRPGVAQRVPGGLGSQIFMTFDT
jgi:hypothetical protein